MINISISSAIFLLCAIGMCVLSTIYLINPSSNSIIRWLTVSIISYLIGYPAALMLRTRKAMFKHTFGRLYWCYSLISAAIVIGLILLNSILPQQLVSEPTRRSLDQICFVLVWIPFGVCIPIVAIASLIHELRCLILERKVISTFKGHWNRGLWFLGIAWPVWIFLAFQTSMNLSTQSRFLTKEQCILLLNYTACIMPLNSLWICMMYKRTTWRRNEVVEN